MSDEELIHKLLLHQEEALQAVKEHYDAMFVYILSQKGLSREDLEECLNDIYVQIWTQIHRYDKEKAALKTFFSVIARNVAYHKLRKNHNYEKHLQDTNMENLSAKQQDFSYEQTKLKQILSNLSHEERALFYRKYFYLQSVEQIASETCRTQRAVEGKLYRLRKKMQKQWKAGDDDEGS